MGYVVGKRMRYLIVLFVVTLGCVRIAAQTPVELFNVGEVPPEFEQTLRELVERFELTRDLLREQIELNARLFTQAEVDALVATIYEENRALRAELKRLRAIAKHEAQRAERFKREAMKFRLASVDRSQQLEATLNAIEDERLLQLGTVFYPRGSLGVFGLINLPDSSVGLYSQFDYHVQTQQTAFGFGFSFALLPQSSLVAFWQRLFPPASP